jgi:hypothetical protein
MAGIPDYMKRVVGWDRTTTQMAERNAELEHLNNHRAQMEGMSAQYKAKNSEYAMVCARKLELSKEMQDIFSLGETLVDYLRTGVRQHYGLNSEQLIAFGLTPTSRRARPVKPAPEQVADPVPAPEPAK